MTESFDLHSITADGLEAAVKRAEHYRLLNQPAEAQSICHDVLAIDPENQQVLVVLVLALTDQFETGEASAQQARGYLDGLTNDYQRAYYQGIISERQGRALLRKGPAAAFAYDSFREAMEWFEEATEIRPEGNDDAILRWNSCVRTIQDSNLEPRPVERELSLE